MAEITLADRRRAALARWKEDPVRFVVEALGATPDEWQVAALRTLKQKRRLSVAACHGVGKDTILTWCILWVMTCHKNCKNPITAPTGHQLYDLAWSELALWFAKLPKFIAREFELNTDTFYNIRHKMTWFTAARTARKDKAEGLQGFHAPTVFIGIDESSGVEEIVFEVLEGATSGEDYYWLCVGNPTRNSGSFHATHTSDERWARIGVAAYHGYDPDVHGPLPDHYFLSRRPSKAFCDNLASKYGKTSAVYYVRALGRFAKSDPDQTIPYEWVSEVVCRRFGDNPLPPKTPLYLGLDIATTGTDDCALVLRQGNVIMGIWTWHNFNEDQTVEHVTAIIQSLWNSGKGPDTLFGDRIGPGGPIMRKLAARVGKSFRTGVVGVHVGETSPDDNCHLLRDCLWWRGRRFFEPSPSHTLSCGLPPVFHPDVSPQLKDRLQAELSLPKYSLTDRKKIKVESKRELKERNVDSPDVADAFLLTLFIAPEHVVQDEAEREARDVLRQQRGYRRRQR